MRHDVVQFPGDPGPLGRRVNLGALIALDRQQSVPFLQRGELLLHPFALIPLPGT